MMLMMLMIVLNETSDDCGWDILVWIKVMDQLSNNTNL